MKRQIFLPSECQNSIKEERELRNKNKAEQLLRGGILKPEKNDSESVYVVKHSANPSVGNCSRNTKTRSGGFFTEEDDPKCLSQKISQVATTYEKDEESSTDEESRIYIFNRQKKRRHFKHSQEEGESSTELKRTISNGESNFDPLEAEPVSCTECNRMFTESMLMKQFDCEICDSCYDRENLHTLVTRTTAKERYLLKDVDFDQRSPPLRYILKRNPHNATWGDMRLYLEAQVVDRALEVWGSEEALETERARRQTNKERSKVKRFERRLKDLRVEMRSSLYTRKTETHSHEFGEEEEDESTGEYVKKCKTCQFEHRYEKM